MGHVLRSYWLASGLTLAVAACGGEMDGEPTEDGSGAPGADAGGDGPSTDDGSNGGPRPGGSSEPGGDDSPGSSNVAGSGSSPGGDGSNAGTPPSAGPTLPLPDAVMTFYVSSSMGDDAWSGSLPEPSGDGSDGPKASLEAALELINGASPGTHVLLRKGDSWDANATLEVRTAVGTEEDPIVLGAYGEGEQPTIVSQHMGNTFTLRSSRTGPSHHFRLDDLHLTSASITRGQTAIYINESLHPELPHHLVFSKLTIEGNATGITMYGNDHLVHGSRIANNTMGMGIYVMGNNVSFQYNEFENNGLPPPDNLVHTLYISACDGVLFEHNVVHSATDGLKVRRSHNGVYRYNTFYGIQAIGIHLGGDSMGGAINNRIESNLFYENSVGIVIKVEQGMQTELVDGLVIANNILHTSASGFIEFGAHLVMTDVPAQNVSIVNNLLYDMIDDHGISVQNSGPNITVANNVVGKFTQGFAYNLDGAVGASNNLEFSSAAEFEALNLVDPAGFDFTPTADSTQLIDQGTDVSDVMTTDYAGDPRPAGAGFDIGPDEYPE